MKIFAIDAKYRVVHIIQSPVSRNSGRFSATSLKYLARLALPREFGGCGSSIPVFPFN